MSPQEAPAQTAEGFQRIRSWLLGQIEGHAFKPGHLLADPVLEEDIRGAIFWDQGGTGEEDMLIAVRKNDADELEFHEIGTASTTFADDVFRIQDDGDPTKELAFQVSTVGAGTTRTLTARAGGTIRFTTSGSGVVEFFSGDDTTIDAGNRIFATAEQHIFFTVDNNTAGQIGFEGGHDTGRVYFRAKTIRFSTTGTYVLLDTDDLTAQRAQAFTDGDGILAIRVAVPATASSAGEPGMWASDASFLYTCHATDTWVRVALGSW